jgi:hypothetical protein
MSNQDDYNEDMEQEIAEDESIEGFSSLVELAKELVAYEDAPDEAILEAWKSTYGKFFISSILGDDTIFLWRTINRTEYKQLINTGVAKNQNSYEDAIVRKCVLWPKVTSEAMAGSDAGVVPTLAKQILYKSGFVSDQVALSLIKVI